MGCDMKRYHLMLAGLLALAATACAPQVDVEAEKNAIREMDRQWENATNANGAEGWVSFVTEDAVLYPPNHPIVRGKEAIGEYMQPQFPPDSSVQWKPDQIEVSSAGDMAFMFGTYEIAFIGPEGDPVSSTGKYGNAWTKMPDDTWIAVASVWNSNQAGTVQAQSALEGEWQIEEVTIVGGDNEGTYSNPQPSLFIFTGRHYSTLLIPGDSPRQQFPEQTTDEERLAAFDNFIANAGTYQVTGSTLTVQPFVAKVPNAMAGEGFAYEYSLNGNSLILVLAGAAWASSDTEIIYRLSRLE